VHVFLDWLAAAGEAAWDADPLGDRLARDHAARDFRRWLKVERRAAASTVNLALASLDALYRQRGLGNPNVRHRGLGRALSPSTACGRRLRSIPPSLLVLGFYPAIGPGRPMWRG
jgi:hypothetical protein